MKKLMILGSTSILLLLIGCSEQSEKVASASAPAVAQPRAAASAPAVMQTPAASVATPAVAEATVPPLPSVHRGAAQAWHLENVKDDLGGAVEIKQTSLDGKYDLVILERGAQPFVSFVRHDRWNSVHNLPGKGTFLVLRAKFEDGQEKHIEWDEVGFSTENVNSALWSYPAKKDALIGPAAASMAESVGGDQLLIQDMLKHKAMLLEVEPGVTTQFDLTDLAHAMEKARSPKAEPVLQAGSTNEPVK